MIFGGQDQDIEQRRTALGLAFLVLGLLLLMWAWGSWMYRTSTRAKPIAIERTDSVDDDSEKAVKMAPGMLVGGVVLVVVFLIGSMVFVRASRRYRLSLNRKANAPTDATDVWSMHRLKDYSDD